MTKPRILYVEDELALAHIVVDTLEKKGFAVRLVSDGAEVMEAFADYDPQLCVLDVMLPHVDGFSLGQKIRQQDAHVPILFLTAKNQTADVVKGFRSGGRDYLRKPFSLDELLVRIENLMALFPPTPSEEVIELGGYTFFPKKLLLAFGEEERKLTYRETEVLSAFYTQKNEILQKRQLLLDIWGDDSLSNSRNLDVYIAKLRDYLSQDARIEIITLRGVGYRFNVEA
ncbi:MAG: response regulator transcription factor [Bacteroidota bacterium]